MKISLKSLILTTLILSLLAGFFPTLSPWLMFSWAGIKHLFLWQFITYLFVERGPISFGFFLALAFNMYILWAFGTQLIERSHTRLFLTLYFGAGILGALFALIDPNAYLAGSTNAVYAILLAWTLLNKEATLLLFFTLPCKAIWLIFGLIGVTLLIDLSNAYWAGAISLIIACLYSYLFTLIVWRTGSPFHFLRRFEKKILQFLERKKVHEFYKYSKIYDIKSGEPVLDDEKFMDAMLDRIARHGEGSLTAQEKKRMNKISMKKGKQNGSR